MNDHEAAFVRYSRVLIDVPSRGVLKCSGPILLIFPIDLMKNFLLLSLALVGVIVILYAGVHGLMKNHSYGFMFTFIGGLTTIGLGLDVVNHLRSKIKKATIRRLGRS
jgi:hypothetical protein